MTARDQLRQRIDNPTGEAMNEAIKVTASIPAWVNGPHSLTNLLDALAAGNHNGVVDALSFSYFDMDEGISNPWIRIGEATITLEVTGQDKLVAAQVRVLKAQIETARAEWLTRQRELMEQISKLQALEYTPEAA